MDRRVGAMVRRGVMVTDGADCGARLGTFVAHGRMCIQDCQPSLQFPRPIPWPPFMWRCRTGWWRYTLSLPGNCPVPGQLQSHSYQSRSWPLFESWTWTLRSPSADAVHCKHERERRNIWTLFFLVQSADSTHMFPPHGWRVKKELVGQNSRNSANRAPLPPWSAIRRAEGNFFLTLRSSSLSSFSSSAQLFILSAVASIKRFVDWEAVKPRYHFLRVVLELNKMMTSTVWCRCLSNFKRRHRFAPSIARMAHESIDRATIRWRLSRGLISILLALCRLNIRRVIIIYNYRNIYIYIILYIYYLFIM